MAKETVTELVEQDRELTVCDDCAREVTHDDGPVELDLCTGCQDERIDRNPDPDTILTKDEFESSPGIGDEYTVRENVNLARRSAIVTMLLIGAAFGCIAIILEVPAAREPAVVGLVVSLALATLASFALYIGARDTLRQYQKLRD